MVNIRIARELRAPRLQSPRSPPPRTVRRRLSASVSGSVRVAVRASGGSQVALGGQGGAAARRRRHAAAGAHAPRTHRTYRRAHRPAEGAAARNARIVGTVAHGSARSRCLQRSRRRYCRAQRLWPLRATLAS
ncbi:unnamed protein product, partial [Iphiclides podalirius]